MKKTEICAVIKYLYLKSISALGVHDDMLGTLPESTPSFATVICRIREFKHGRDSVKDELKLGQTLTATIKDNIDFCKFSVNTYVKYHTVR